jgi:flagellar motility protein MotE (MotC chaperone)
MKKNYKKIFGYAIVMAACALILVLMTCISEHKLADYQEEYQEDISISKNQIIKLEERIADLEKEKSELQKKLEEKLSLESDLITGQQARADLKEIYDVYKSGKVAEAKRRIKMIEPVGFDDATLSYYEVILDLLK